MVNNDLEREKLYFVYLLFQLCFTSIYLSQMTFEKGSSEDQIKLFVMKEDILICFVHFILLYDNCVVRLSLVAFFSAPRDVVMWVNFELANFSQTNTRDFMTLSDVMGFSKTVERELASLSMCRIKCKQ